MYTTSDFKTGLKIQIDGEPYEIIEFTHVKPGKGGAFYRTKVRHLLTGNVLEKMFKAGEKVKPADVEEREMEYLYNDGENYYFMDKENFDQIHIPKENIEDKVKFLKENTDVTVIFHKKVPVTIELPQFVELEVVETDPGIRGDTVSGGSKPAKLETGAVVLVPLFINIGDKIKIDTRTKKYVERV